MPLLLLSRSSRVLTLCDPIDSKPTRLPRPWDSPGENTGLPFPSPMHGTLEKLEKRQRKTWSVTCSCLYQPPPRKEPPRRRTRRPGLPEWGSGPPHPAPGGRDLHSPRSLTRLRCDSQGSACTPRFHGRALHLRAQGPGRSPATARRSRKNSAPSVSGVRDLNTRPKASNLVWTC